jgi:proliferating cell nuclear antigen
MEEAMPKTVWKTKGKIAKRLFKAMNVLVDEIRLDFSEKGLTAKAVDAANVAMVVMETDDVKTDLPFSIGADLYRIVNFLKSVPDGEEVVMTFSPETIKVKAGRAIYNVMAINPDAIRRPPKIPDLDLPAKLAVSAQELKKGISTVSKVADTIKMEATADSLVLRGKGDVEKIKVELETIDHNGREATALFAKDYLGEFAKVLNDETVTIRLGTNFPLWIEIPTEGGKVTYILAPRIEEE